MDLPWFYERSIEEALKLPKGAYCLDDNVRREPQETDVIEAARELNAAVGNLREPQPDQGFPTQSAIMRRAQKEGRAFVDWPEIKVLP